MSLRHAALGLLAKHPASGYDLLKEFQLAMGKVWPATQSQLYGELNKMAASGLIKVSNLGPRGRKEYAITDAGRAELRRWLTDTHEDPPVRNAALLRVLMLGQLTPSEARVHLEMLRSWSEQEHAFYELLRNSYDWSNSDDDFFLGAALEHGLRWSQVRTGWASWVLEELGRRGLARQAGSSTS